MKYKKTRQQIGVLSGNKTSYTFTFVIKILASNLINSFEVLLE